VKDPIRERVERIAADRPAGARCVMIIAGEASGDLHGAALVRAMAALDPTLFFCGIGGAALRSAGVRILADSAALAVVGITEVFSKLPSLIKGLSGAKRLLGELRPDLLILIDFPDFNLKVAARAKKLEIPVLYYISPQIWAWRQGRVKTIKERVDHVAVILPFEAPFFQDHGVPVTFVGHPLIESAPSLQPSAAPEGGEPVSPVVGLLPGSRDREVMRHLPVMTAAAKLLKERIPGIGFLVSAAPSIAPSLLEETLGPDRESGLFRVMSGGVHAVFRESTLLVAASGTVTLEAAIYGIPMVIIYKVSPVSYWLGRALVRVDHAGLANLIAGRTVVPELIQADASPERIADAVAGLLDDPGRLRKMQADLAAVRARMGGPGASRRTAEIALSIMDRPPGRY
jgi:lipid-A-disaccharide synthase